MLKLFHGTTSVCSAKVRLCLHEKHLNWEGEVLDLQSGDQHRPDYLSLNPNSVVPTLVHDDQIIIESTIILEYLEDRFPSVPMMPDDPIDRARVREWTKWVDEKLHAAAGQVTFATANRKVLLLKTPDELEAHFARIPDLAYRKRQRAAVAGGLEAPFVKTALQVFGETLERMDRALASNHWLVGHAFSIADAAIAPYINRADILGMDSLWKDRLPRVCEWWTRVQNRSSFQSEVRGAMTPKDKERFDIDRDDVAQKLRSVLSLG